MKYSKLEDTVKKAIDELMLNNFVFNCTTFY